MVEPMMDRPAYELVRLIEAALDDADQITDTPQSPNRISVWGIRVICRVAWDTIASSAACSTRPVGSGWDQPLGRERLVA